MASEISRLYDVRVGISEVMAAVPAAVCTATVTM